MNIRMTLAAGAALLGTAAFAGFDIDIDLNAKPIRDASESTSKTLVGYAGCFCDQLSGGVYQGAQAYWFGTNKVETSKAMREAGAWFQRMWSANRWFADRVPNPYDPNSTNKVEVKKYKNYIRTDPDLAFGFWKRNGIKVLFTLEAWNEKDEKTAVEFVKWIVDNGYKDVVAGFELGNESYFSEHYPELAPRWKRIIDEIWKIWPKVPLGICLCELFEQNPDLAQVRGRMLSAGEIKKGGYFSASLFNRYTTQFVVAMADHLDKISHVIYHAYGAETPYSCSYYGFERFRNYLEAMPELKGKKMWLSEVRMRSDEDNWCQRQFRESLIMGHYALTAICQPEMDGYNQHECGSWSGAFYLSNGRQFTHQLRTGCWWPGYSDHRAPENRPRIEVGPMGVMYRILSESILDYPILLQHGTSRETNTTNAFYTSARLTDEVYRRRRAIREGKTAFLGLFGGVPEVKGETEWVAAMSKKRNTVCLMMVNSKNEEETATVRVKDRILAVPTYVTVSCPEEYLDCASVPGEAHPWKEMAWEDSQQGGFDAIHMAMYDGIKPKNDVLKIRIAPHTVQSVTFRVGKVPKK